MNPDKIDYKFCADFLRYAYHVMGYDALIREANYIHHLYMPSNTVTVPQISQQTIPEIVTDSDSAPENTTTKNIVIDENHSTKVKYTRSQLSDDLRCTSIISNGSRCTFKRADNSEHCGRHITQ
jgi:hypothetical protein